MINQSPVSRRHDIDAIRVFAFGLLILYHVGMFYVYDWGWHIKSAYQSEWLQLPMLLTNQWRMPIIFLVSGLAVSFVLGRYRNGVFALRRLWRLLLPLLFGMLVIVAPQAYIEAVTQGVIEPGFGQFYWRYLTRQDFPPEAWGGAEIITWTWNHLWYLPYLLLYTLLLIPLAAFLHGPGQAAVRAFRNLRGSALIVIPILPLLVYGIFIFPVFPYVSHALIDDGYAHAMYFTFFLYGWLMGNDVGLWTELAVIRRRTLSLACTFFILWYAVNLWLPDDSFPLQEGIGLTLTYLNRWTWIVTILGWGYQLLNRPYSWLPYATEAVYPWYILHQTIIVVVGYQLSRFSLGPVVEPILLLLATIAGCYILNEYLVRRVNLLRPLFGLPWRRSDLRSPFTVRTESVG